MALYYYNGVSAYPLLGPKVKDIVINSSYSSKAVSIVYKNKLYCAFPEGTSTVNNAIFVYDLTLDNLMIWRGINVTDFIEYEDNLLFSNSTGNVYKIDNSVNFDGTAIESYWETPWQDLDAFRATKITDTLYFYASGAGSIQVSLTFDGRTKTKTKQLDAGGKLYSIPFDMEGRRFKLKFSNLAGSQFELKSPELTYEAGED